MPAGSAMAANSHTVGMITQTVALLLAWIAPKGEAAMDWMEYQCQALGGIYHPGQACQDPGPD